MLTVLTAQGDNRVLTVC